MYMYNHVCALHMYTRLLKRRLNQLDKVLPVSMDDSCPACPKVKILNLCIAMCLCNNCIDMHACYAG